MATFVDHLVPIDIIDYLVSGVEPVLTINEMQILNLSTKDNVTGARELIERILKKCDTKIILFKKVLTDHGYDYLAKHLEEPDRECIPGSDGDGVSNEEYTV